MSEITFKVTFGKQTLPVTMPQGSTVKDLKDFLQSQTGVPSNLQKLFLKGLLKDDEALLAALPIRPTTKILLVGSTVDDISQTSNIRANYEEEKKIDFSGDGFSAEQQRIIDKGPPAGCIAGDLFSNLDVPESIPGLYNHLGVPIRLTVKKELDEIWMVTNSNTKKVPFMVVADVSFVPIVRFPGYGVLTLNLGKANKFNVYFFPQQFFRSFKTLVAPFYVEGNNVFDLFN